MKDVQSHNTALANSLRRTLVPSLGQVVLYIIFGFLLLVALNIGALWTYFNDSVGVSAETANGVVGDQVGRFSDFIGNLFEGRLAPMLFWAFLGVLTYTLIWLFQNTATSVRNDMAAGNYKHPWTFKPQKYWRSVVSRKIFLVCSLFLMSVFIYLCVVFWLPILARLFYVAIYNWQPLDSVWRIAVATLAVALLIYLFLTLARTARNTWRWVTNNL